MDLNRISVWRRWGYLPLKSQFLKGSLVSALALWTGVISGQVIRADSTLLHIWKPGRVYDYHVTYLEATGDTLSDARLVMQPTGKIWDVDEQQTLATFLPDFSSEDSARLAPNPANDRHKRWMRRYHEGVIEDGRRVWMHPLRENQYVLTEVAPFPEAMLPLREGQTWKSQLFIYEAMGSFEGKLSSSYAVMGQTTAQTPEGERPCWEIFATGLHDGLGRSSVTFLFDEDMGFVSMDYRFFNGRRLVLQLVGLQRGDE